VFSFFLMPVLLKLSHIDSSFHIDNPKVKDLILRVECE
jgi:hypothetical protein